MRPCSAKEDNGARSEVLASEFMAVMGMCGSQTDMKDKVSPRVRDVLGEIDFAN